MTTMIMMTFLFVASNAAKFGFRTCTTPVDAHAQSNDALTLWYQWDSDLYSCEISSTPLHNTPYTCDTASVPRRGPCDGGDFFQINKMGTDDVCIAAIIVNGEEMEVQAQRLGDDVNSNSGPDQSEGISEVYKRRYSPDGHALPSGYESTAAVAIECTAYVFDHEQ